MDKPPNAYFDRLFDAEAGVLTRKQSTSSRSLTKRQTEVLAFIAKGLTNAEIGAILGCTPGTVKAHVANIIQRLNVSNRTEAACEWSRDLALRAAHDKA